MNRVYECIGYVCAYKLKLVCTPTLLFSTEHCVKKNKCAYLCKGMNRVYEHIGYVCVYKLKRVCTPTQLLSNGIVRTLCMKKKKEEGNPRHTNIDVQMWESYGCS